MQHLILFRNRLAFAACNFTWHLLCHLLYLFNITWHLWHFLQFSWHLFFVKTRKIKMVDLFLRLLIIIRDYIQLWFYATLVNNRYQKSSQETNDIMLLRQPWFLPVFVIWWNLIWVSHIIILIRNVYGVDCRIICDIWCIRGFFISWQRRNQTLMIINIIILSCVDGTPYNLLLIILIS